MKSLRLKAALVIGCLVIGLALCANGGKTAKGVRVIRAEDMKPHLEFLAAPEFRGRNAPSAELDIASKYIALTAERIGLQPLMSDGTFYQEVPVEVTTIFEQGSRLSLHVGGREQVFRYPESFSPGRYVAEGRAAGEAVFLGFGLSAPQLDWDDCQGLDLEGKFAVILDVALPKEHVLKPEENRRLLRNRGFAARAKGAVGVITVIAEEREARLEERGLSFDKSERLRFPDIVTGPGAVPSRTVMSGRPAQPAAAFFLLEVRREAGAAILGVGREELDQMATAIRQGRQVKARRLPGRKLEVRVETGTRKEKTMNVVGYIEGLDPELRNEFIAISSHHDHLPVREGRIYPGSDDNASGAVGMFEVAEALMAERPKRSVIFIWNTAEEKGLIGSYYFVQHCPVPVEKISANLNLDMISRNGPDHLYIVGSNKLSTELDESIQRMNARSTNLKLDYEYEDPKHPDRFFFRSDQYPYLRYGIPGAWFFCGTTEDYHTEGDIEAKADYLKMEKVAKLVYLVAMDIGDKPELLKLDVHPEVKARGEENMKVGWR